jgi:hypothetical protein
MAILGVVAVAVYGCGGSSSSSTGPSNLGAGGSAGGSGGVVQGQILRGTGSAQAEPIILLAFRAALGIGLAEAAAGTPLPDATVTLSGTGGTFTQTTDANGMFKFTDLPAGTYTIAVCAGTPCVAKPVLQPSPAEITVGPADVGTVNGTVFNDDTVLTSVDVTSESVSAQGVFNNDAQLCIASRIAQGGNVSLGSVIAERQQHMGWGKIAHLHNLPSSVIGGGNHCDAAQLDDIRAANGQDVGPGNGHGNGKAKGKGKA